MEILKIILGQFYRLGSTQKQIADTEVGFGGEWPCWVPLLPVNGASNGMVLADQVGESDDILGEDAVRFGLLHGF